MPPLQPASHLLWPAPNSPPSPVPEVSLAQTSDPRDSIIFACLVAYSAAIRLLTTSLPLRGSAAPTLIALLVASAAPTVLAVILAVVPSSQRPFSWLWAQLVLLIALCGALFATAVRPLPPVRTDSTIAVSALQSTSALRDLRWGLVRHAPAPRLFVAATGVVASIAACVVMEGWDVLALTFSAAVLVALGIEPKPRSVSPVFNALPPGFPSRALAVRSLRDGRPSNVVYRTRWRGRLDATITHEFSIYPNANLGIPLARVLLGGLIGFSLLNNVQERTDGVEASGNTGTDTRDRDRSGRDDSAAEEEGEGNEMLAGLGSSTRSSYTLQDVWPWLREAPIDSISNSRIALRVTVMRNFPEFEDNSKVEAAFIDVKVRAPREQLRQCLSLCSMTGAGTQSNGIAHYHLMQLWSQWLEVHAQYATSGRAYASGIEIVEDENISDRTCPYPRLRKAEIRSRHNAFDEQVIMSSAEFAGGNPSLGSVRTALTEEETMQLEGRYIAAQDLQGAVGGDWLVRVLSANQVDEIIDSQAEFAALLGLPIAALDEVVRDPGLKRRLHSDSGQLCRAGLLVPGPAIGLLEAVRDCSLETLRDKSRMECAWMALLANFAFDVVAWGTFGVESGEQQLQYVLSMPSSAQMPRFVGKGRLQSCVMDSLLACKDTDFLYTRLVRVCSFAFRGLNDYNASQLKSYPLQRATVCRVLAGKIDVRSRLQKDITNRNGEDRDLVQDVTPLSENELLLLAPERMAILQLGISSFFAISALLRAL